MLERYRGAIEGLPADCRGALARRLDVPHYPNALFEVLDGAGLGQADVVLALLHEGTEPCLRAAEAMVGHPILRCPPGLRRMPRDELGLAWVTRLVMAGELSGADARRVVRIYPNPRLVTTPSWGRFRLLRVGMTVGQFLMRGGTRRDVREWQAEGTVELST